MLSSLQENVNECMVSSQYILQQQQQQQQTDSRHISVF